MTMEREAVDEGRRKAAPVSPGVVVAYALLLAGLLAWFLYGVLVQRQGLVDSMGESLGTGFALLLIVSIVGTLRRGRG